MQTAELGAQRGKGQDSQRLCVSCQGQLPGDNTTLPGQPTLTEVEGEG